jgi:hypothetical protein
MPVVVMRFGRSRVTSRDGDRAAGFVSQPSQTIEDRNVSGSHDPSGHMFQCLIDSLSAFQGRGPSTILLLNVLAHRRPEQGERIDSRTQIPLFRVWHMDVNEKQPFKGCLPQKKLCVQRFNAGWKNADRRDSIAAAVTTKPKSTASQTFGCRRVR